MNRRKVTKGKNWHGREKICVLAQAAQIPGPGDHGA